MRKTAMIVVFAVLATPSLASAETFSAIAISPNSGAYGEGHDWPTIEKARRQAMRYCRENANDPDDCRVVTWSKGAYCAAVAATNRRSGGVTWGSASGPDLGTAKAKAYDACANQLGSECDKILVSVCSH